MTSAACANISSERSIAFLALTRHLDLQVTANQELLLIQIHQESVYMANVLVVAIAKRTAISWPRTRANTGKCACQVAKTQTQAAPTKLDPTTPLHNPRQRE